MLSRSKWLMLIVAACPLLLGAGGMSLARPPRDFKPTVPIGPKVAVLVRAETTEGTRSGFYQRGPLPESDELCSALERELQELLAAKGYEPIVLPHELYVPTAGTLLPQQREFERLEPQLLRAAREAGSSSAVLVYVNGDQRWGDRVVLEGTEISRPVWTAGFANLWWLDLDAKYLNYRKNSASIVGYEPIGHGRVRVLELPEWMHKVAEFLLADVAEYRQRGGEVPADRHVSSLVGNPSARYGSATSTTQVRPLFAGIPPA